MKIVISGTTGVGKSTTVKLLKKKLELMGKKVTVAGELVVDSPYFNLYFNDLAEWGSLAQLDFLLERFKQYIELEIKLQENPNQVIIFDRHFLEDKIFSHLKAVKAAVSAFDTNIHNIIWQELVDKIQDFDKPDYFVLLKADFDIVEDRMKKRGRSQEEKFNQRYWQDLYWRYYNSNKYRTIFKDYSKNFLELSTDDTNPEQVVENIIKYISKRSGF